MSASIGYKEYRDKPNERREPKNKKNKYKHARFENANIGESIGTIGTQSVKKKQKKLLKNGFFGTGVLTAKKIFECYLCSGKHFSRRAGLKRHMDNQHVKKPYICSHCSTEIKNRENLANHLKKYCPKAKLYKNPFWNHELTIEPNAIKVAKYIFTKKSTKSTDQIRVKDKEDKGTQTEENIDEMVAFYLAKRGKLNMNLI